MDITIKRDLAGVDWEEMANLYWEGMVVAGEPGRLELPRPTGSAWEDYVRLTRGEFEGSDLVCLAYAGGRCVGAVHAITDNARDGTVYGLVVHPDFRGQGIGTRMMTELLADLHHVSVLLHATTLSEGLCRRLGFRTLKRGMALRYTEADYEP